jgi:hypothetical protein
MLRPRCRGWHRHWRPPRQMQRGGWLQTAGAAAEWRRMGRSCPRWHQTCTEAAGRIRKPFSRQMRTVQGQRCSNSKAVQFRQLASQTPKVHGGQAEKRGAHPSRSNSALPPCEAAREKRGAPAARARCTVVATAAARPSAGCCRAAVAGVGASKACRGRGRPWRRAGPEMLAA